MMNKIINKARLKFQKINDNRFWKPLLNHQDAYVRKMAFCLHFISHNKEWTNQEREKLRKILEIREYYNKSKDTIEVIDYGAGKPDSDRSVSKMEEGVLVKRDIAEIYNTAASPESYGRLMFKIVEQFKPQVCLELGTSLGVSGAYQISALELNKSGKLVSIEGSPNVAAVTKETYSRFGLSQYKIEVGKFKDVLIPILEKLDNVDFVFIDGHHNEYATLEYFEMVYPYLANNAVVIFDDINWSKGMQNAWDQIKKDSKIYQSFELKKWGISLIDKESSRPGKQFNKIPL